MAREYDQAIEQLRNTVDMDPSFVLPHLVLGQAYEQKKAFDQAIAELRRAADISKNSPPVLAALARTYAVSGRKAEARNLLDGLLVANEGGKIIRRGAGNHLRVLKVALNGQLGQPKHKRTARHPIQRGGQIRRENNCGELRRRETDSNTRR